MSCGRVRWHFYRRLISALANNMQCSLSFELVAVPRRDPIRMQVVCLAALSPSRLLLTRQINSHFIDVRVDDFSKDPWPAWVLQGKAD